MLGNVRFAKQRAEEERKAVDALSRFGASSVAAAMEILQDRGASTQGRQAAARYLGAFRCRDAVARLIETLSEGDRDLSWTCMRALLAIGSRRYARRLMQIARGGYPVAPRQEAIYALWWLGEWRAEQLFIHLSASLPIASLGRAWPSD